MDVETYEKAIDTASGLIDLNIQSIFLSEVDRTGYFPSALNILAAASGVRITTMGIPAVEGTISKHTFKHSLSRKFRH